MKPLKERFFAKVRLDKRGCWIWQGYIDPSGYGRLNIGGRDEGIGYAHRVSYEIHKGPIPDGLVLDHLCRNTWCVNPDHLEPVLHQVNIKRGAGGISPTERELQSAVIECAQLLGFRVAHFRPAQTARGWRTPVEADGGGFPDLVMAKRGRLIFAELKSARGKLSAEQEAWLEALTLTSWSTEVYLWRPADWTSGVIENTLRDRSWLANLRRDVVA